MTATAARAVPRPVPAVPRPVLDDYVRTHIRVRAVWLCQQEGFRPDEREDLEQELALEAVRRFAKHQPQLSGLRTFLVRAVNGKVSKLLRERGTDKAKFRQQIEPLEEPEARRLRTPGRSAQELIDLRMDVAHLVASLPHDLREVCQQLMEGDPPEAFPPAVMWELRQRFEAAGMRDYLVERE